MKLYQKLSALGHPVYIAINKRRKAIICPALHAEVRRLFDQPRASVMNFDAINGATTVTSTMKSLETRSRVIDLEHVTTCDFRSLAATDTVPCVRQIICRHCSQAGGILEQRRRIPPTTTRVVCVVIVFQTNVMQRRGVYLSTVYLCLSHLYAEAVPQRPKVAVEIKLPSTRRSICRILRSREQCFHS